MSNKNKNDPFGIIITDALLAELDKFFGPRMIEYVDTWEQTCELKGKLQVIRWLKNKQQEIKEELHTTGEAKVTINTS